VYSTKQVPKAKKGHSNCTQPLKIERTSFFDTDNNVCLHPKNSFNLRFRLFSYFESFTHFKNTHTNKKLSSLRILDISLNCPFYAIWTKVYTPTRTERKILFYNLYLLVSNFLSSLVFLLWIRRSCNEFANFSSWVLCEIVHTVFKLPCKGKFSVSSTFSFENCWFDINVTRFLLSGLGRKWSYLFEKKRWKHTFFNAVWIGSERLGFTFFWVVFIPFHRACL